MTTVDWIIIGIVLGSTLLSLWRGVTREILSLITWILAAYLGFKFAGLLDGMLSAWIDSQSVRYAVGFIIIFLVIMIIGGLLNRVLSQFISFTGLTLLDRLLGLAFGAARGILIVTVCVLLASYTTLPKDGWWQTSQLLPHFDGVSKSLGEWVQKQGLDTEKIESFIDKVEGKPAKEEPTKEPAKEEPAKEVPPSPPAVTPAPAQGTAPQTPNILGKVPSQPKDGTAAQQNMLNGQVAPTK